MVHNLNFPYPCRPETELKRTVPAHFFLSGLVTPVGEEGRGRDEPVARALRIAKPFALSVFELTLSEWAACELDGYCRKRPNWSKDNPNPLIPATHISFEDAKAYVAWLSARSGRASCFQTPSSF